MTRQWHSIVRKMAPILSAGLLLQAGGCSIDLGTTIQGLVTAAVNDLIASFVYGLFNIPLTGF